MNWHRYVFPTMGTVGNLLYQEHDEMLEGCIEDLLRDYDGRFSLYNPQSELSRINRGEMSLPQASDQLRKAYEEAMHWYRTTGALFTPHTINRQVDLNGVVKALAMQSVADLVESTGRNNWSLNIGGDVLVAGHDMDEEDWRIGVADPRLRDQLQLVVTLKAPYRALATSGSAERGDHIWLQGERQELIQASIMAPTIVEADVLATAVIASGEVALANDMLLPVDVGVFMTAGDGQVFANTLMQTAAGLDVAA